MKRLVRAGGGGGVWWQIITPHGWGSEEVKVTGGGEIWKLPFGEEGVSETAKSSHPKWILILLMPRVLLAVINYWRDMSQWRLIEQLWVCYWLEIWGLAGFRILNNLNHRSLETFIVGCWKNLLNCFHPAENALAVSQSSHGGQWGPGGRGITSLLEAKYNWTISHNDSSDDTRNIPPVSSSSWNYPNGTTESNGFINGADISPGAGGDQNQS